MSERLKMERLSLRPRSGDKCGCAKCLGFLKVANTIVNHDTGYRVQYLACELCAWRPENNKLVIPLEFAPPRVHRS